MGKFTFRSIIARHKQQEGKIQASFLKKLMYAGGLFLASIIVLSSIFLLFIVKDLPNLSNINEIIFSESSIIYDRDGEELYTLHGDENRKIIPSSEIPDDLVFSTMAIEDDKFFEHHGFSFTGIIKAVLSEVLHFGEHKQGGSTLTQQFVKNTFLTREKTYTRKIKELILSLQIEWKFSKDDIMAMYLNSIPYGSNAYGVEQASQMFFGKHAQNLTLAESVILAALPQAPTYYSPYGEHIRTSINLPEEEIKNISANNYAEFLDAVGEDILEWGLLPKKQELRPKVQIMLPGRTSLVLNRMRDLGFISKSLRDETEIQLTNFTFKKYHTEIKAPHFVMYVRDILEQKYGKEFVQAGGLKIYTTLDSKLQEFAEITLKDQVEKNIKRYGANNAALISAIPKTGEILAMVGSRDYWNEEIDGNVNVNLQRRLPGSSFKPFAYAAAFSAGYAPATVLFDLETDFGNDYKPKNFDGTFHGPITMRNALGHSLNIPAIKTGMLGGLQRTYDIAKGMGLSFQKDAEWYGGALPLGVAEIRPIDMLQAYATFANLGERIELTPILKVMDKNGNILMQHEAQGQQVLDRETAYLITDVLADPNARGEGWNGVLQLPGRKNAVKTGTSNKRTDKDLVLPLDGWVAGYTPELATIVWTGNNDGTPMNMAGSGFSNAGPIWRKFMIEALKDKPATDFEKPAGITAVLVSSLSGKLPNANFPKSLIRKDIFSSKNIPTEYDNLLDFVEVDKVTGELPNEFTPEGSKKKAAVVRWISEHPDNPNWEEPVQRWAKNYSEEYFSRLGITDVLAKAPEKIESLHTKNNTQNQPEIRITSPVNYGEVSLKKVGVWVDVQSNNGVASVEFYLDDELVDTQRSAPYKGNIIFPSTVKIGDAFTIKAKIYDTLYNSNSSSVQVKLSKDDQAPITEIIFPQNKQNFPAGSLISIQTNTYDIRSDIDRVEFYFNGKKIGKTTVAPYVFQYQIPAELGLYPIKVLAFDQSANSAEHEITIQVGASESAQNLDIKVPSTIKFGNSEEITMYVPTKDSTEISKIELIARYKTVDGVVPEDAILQTIDNFLTGGNGIFFYRWIRPLVGEYEIFIKASYKSGKVLFSTKKQVRVE